jgi:hypothetical protein
MSISGEFFKSSCNYGLSGEELVGFFIDNYRSIMKSHRRFKAEEKAYKTRTEERIQELQTFTRWCKDLERKRDPRLNDPNFKMKLKEKKEWLNKRIDEPVTLEEDPNDTEIFAYEYAWLLDELEGADRSIRNHLGNFAGATFRAVSTPFRWSCEFTRKIYKEEGKDAESIKKFLTLLGVAEDTIRDWFQKTTEKAQTLAEYDVDEESE